jgi:hypothetical protein
VDGEHIDRIVERARVAGRYELECFDRDGNIKWRDNVDNLIARVGLDYLLDSALSASALTTVGPFMGLISSVSYSAIAAGDTMASHAGWREAGSTNAPTISGTRMTLNGLFSASSAGIKGMSSNVTFNFTGTGTVKGVFLVTGSGAVATLMSTAGTLFSAGLFTGGDKVVGNGDTLNASFTATLT